MEKYNVRVLVNHLLGTREPDWEHVQTVKISERSHAKLRALAEVVGRSKTSLAADLLTAAIDDAIDAVPNEPHNDYQLADGPTGLRDYIRISASSLYEMACFEHEGRVAMQHEKEQEEQRLARERREGTLLLQDGYVNEEEDSE